MNSVKIGDFLVNNNKITSEQLADALDKQKSIYPDKRIGEILLTLGYINDFDLANSLSESLNIPVISFKNVNISLDIVFKIPKILATKYKLLAIEEDDFFITIAMSDPLDYYAIEDIKSILPKPIKIVLASISDIDNYIELFYKEEDAQKAIQKINVNKGNIVQDNVKIRVNINEPVVGLINSLLLKAESIGASDIHIEPCEHDIKIRLRVDGQLIEYSTLQEDIKNQIVNRIKIMSNLNIAEKRLPQDGQFHIVIENLNMNIRVSIFPTIYGEKVVMRFLNSNTIISNFDTFGMNNGNFCKAQEILKSPHGMIYLTGPTGSGKSTTLYMMLEHIKNGNINISTIEDPVEKFIDGINQTQINVAAGLTFDVGLRSLLRQDPDVLMVGETRDRETAKTAVSAAITGHLVLSTLHTNDAPSAIIRLEDMGVEPYLVANSLVGVISQRLTRKICPECKEKYNFTDSEKMLTGLSFGYRGKGCPSCNHTGYKGRIALHEIINVDSGLRDIISKKEHISEVYRYLNGNRYHSLKENIIDEIKKSNTTTDELIRLLGVNC